MNIKVLLMAFIVAALCSCNADKQSTLTPAERELIERSYSGDKNRLQKFASLGPFVELKKEDLEDCNTVTGFYQISIPPSGGDKLKSDIGLIAEMLAKDNLLKDPPDADCGSEPVSTVFLYESKEAFDQSKWVAKCTVKKSEPEGKVDFGEALKSHL